MAYQVRNRFINADSQTAIQGPSPIRMQMTAPAPPDPRGSPVTGSGPGFAAANVGENRFLPNGKIMLSANDPDAPGLAQKNPGMYELPPGMNPNGSTAAGNRFLGAAMGPNPFQMEDRPIAMARGGVINEPIDGVGRRTGNKYLMGEAGPEMVSPMRANGEQSFETDGGQLSDEMIEMLQKVLGRRIFKKGRRNPISKHGMHRGMTQNTTRGVNAPVIAITDEEVRMIANRPELRPMMNVLLAAEKRGGIQITNRSGDVFTHGPSGELTTIPAEQADMNMGGNSFDQGEVSSQFEQTGNEYTGYDPMGSSLDPGMTSEPARAEYLPGSSWSGSDLNPTNGSQVDAATNTSAGYIPQETWSGSDPNPTNSSSSASYTGTQIEPYIPQASWSGSDLNPTNSSATYATEITPSVPSTSWSGSDPNPTNSSYSYPTTTTQPTPSTAQLDPGAVSTPGGTGQSGFFNGYSAGGGGGGGGGSWGGGISSPPAGLEQVPQNTSGQMQMAQPYVPAPIYQQPMPSGGGSWSGSDPNPTNSGAYEPVQQQVFSPSDLQSMLQGALTRSGYNSGSSLDQGEVASPSQIIPGYSSTSISFDPGIVETDAERMMRIASSGGSSTGRLQ